MPLLKKNAKTVPFLAIIANPVPSCAHLPSVCPHMRFPRSAPTQDAKGQTQCKDRGSSSTVHQNRLFDDARPCEAWMMHFEATNDDIKGSYQFISIVYLDQVHRIYSLVWAHTANFQVLFSIFKISVNEYWMSCTYIYLSAGDDLPIICGFQSLLDPDSPGGKLLKQFRS